MLKRARESMQGSQVSKQDRDREKAAQTELKNSNKQHLITVIQSLENSSSSICPLLKPQDKQRQGG